MAFTRPRAAQIDFDATNISDTLIRINSTESGDNANDLGIVFERGNHTNAAIIWDESAGAFRFISTTHDSSTTTSDINISAHHNLHVGTLEASAISIGSTAVTSTATELNLLDGVTGISLGNANELVIVDSDGTGFASSSTLSIDDGNNYIGINQTSPEVTLHMTGDGAQTAQIRMEQHNDTADAPDVRTRRSRGTAASPSNLSAGDYLFRINAEAYQSGTYATLGSIQLDTSSSDVSKGVIQFQTHDGTSLATRLQILDSGAIRFNSAYTFPTSDGSANQILTTNGSGVLSFASPASSSFTLAADSGTSDSFSTGGTLTFEGGTGVDTTVSNDQISIAIDSTVTTLSGTQTLTNKTLTSPTINDPTFGGVLALNSTSTTVSPLTLTANSLNDNVGALRINGSEPDIFLNQAASGFTTVTFARTISSVVQPMVGFGKNSSDNLYMFRETAQDAANSTVYDNTSFVLNRSTGNISMAHDLAVTGEVSYGTLNDGTTTLTSTVAELNYVDGVTSNIQTQLDGKIDTTGNNTITSTTAGSSAAPEFELFRDITGADSNYIGQIKFSADNDADQKTVFAKITGKIGDASDGTEDGIIEIAHVKAGSNNINVRMTSTEFKIMNGTDFDVETHDGSSNGLRLNNTLVTATATELNLLDGITGVTLDNAGDLLIVGSDGTSIDSSALLNIDTGNGRLGIGTSSPARTLHLVGDTQFEGSMRIDQYHTSSDGPDILFQKARGTPASTTAAANGDELIKIVGLVHDGTDFQTRVRILSDTVLDGSDYGANIQFQTGDGAAPTTRFTIAEDGNITVADGAFDFDIAAHDGTNGLKLGGTLVTSSAAELNRLDGIGSAAVGLTDTQTLTNKTLTSAQVTTDIRLNARAELEFYDTDSSHYVSFRAPASITSNTTWTLPASDGTDGQVLSTDGAGTLSFADAGSGGGGSGSSYPNSTFQTLPGTNGDFDLAFNVAQTSQETPFESGGTDAFGVNLGSVFSLMDPVGSIETVSESGLDLGVLT